MANDTEIRLAAFKWLKEQIMFHGEVLPWALISEGFQFKGEQIHLIGASGIWKPKMMDLPISITTKFDGPYQDSFSKEGLLMYRYRGGYQDVNHRDNEGLRQIMRQNIPLIYFCGVAKGRYFTSFPVYIIKDDPTKLTFTVQVDNVESLNKPAVLEDTDTTHWRRVYATTSAKIRLHQQRFRERVLFAYNNQCTLCRLKHPELLDAAHIIGDTEEFGDPIVPNGLSLCKIHHAAFDKNIIGITPDYQVSIRTDVLEETDGPMLRFGLQELNMQKLILPSRKKDWPDRERLEIRYTQFKKVG